MLAAGSRDEGRSLPPCRYPSGAEAGSGCCSAGREHPLPAPTHSPSRRCSAPPQPQPAQCPFQGEAQQQQPRFLTEPAGSCQPPTASPPRRNQPRLPQGLCQVTNPTGCPPGLPSPSQITQNCQQSASYYEASRKQPLLFASPQTKPRHSPAANHTPPTTPARPPQALPNP